MYQIEMIDENMLVTKVEDENKSDFDSGGSSTDPRGAVYKVVHASADSQCKEGELILLSPGHYEGLQVAGQMYTVIKASDVLAKVTEAKQ